MTGVDVKKVAHMLTKILGERYQHGGVDLSHIPAAGRASARKLIEAAMGPLGDHQFAVKYEVGRAWFDAPRDVPTMAVELANKIGNPALVTFMEPQPIPSGVSAGAICHDAKTGTSVRVLYDYAAAQDHFVMRADVWVRMSGQQESAA